MSTLDLKLTVKQRYGNNRPNQYNKTNLMISGYSRNTVINHNNNNTDFITILSKNNINIQH